MTGLFEYLCDLIVTMVYILSVSGFQRLYSPDHGYDRSFYGYFLILRPPLADELRHYSEPVFGVCNQVRFKTRPGSLLNFVI